MAFILCAVCILAASLHDCEGDLRFASYYGDHMVLQKSPESAVLWGYGPEGTQVTITLSGPSKQKTSPVTVTKGIWRVTLDPVEAGGPYNVTAANQSSTATLTDVLFGDIWLCGGQSNMWLQMYKIFNASQELYLAGKYPYVRTFMASLQQSEIEQTDLIQVELPWSVPPTNTIEFSAVCWLFGRYLYDTLQYPIGLVESCWGGTPIEVWSSPKALQQCGLQQTNSGPKEYSVLWNAMIHPLLNMTIKGAIWYQGEANTDYNQEKYSCSFPAMIDDWRMAFHQGSGGQTALDFPFGFVQLSTDEKGSQTDAFPNIRWHQTADIGYVPNLRMQRTFMAVALDLPDETSPYGTIHPRDKQDVAYRLSLGARAVAYNDNEVSFQGPFPEEIHLFPMSLNITYDQGVSVTPSKDIFEICCTEIQTPCGPESPWVPAPIVHWGPTTVQLSTILCPPTEKVAALRYAWRDWPCGFKACAIYSTSGVLPAHPFIANCPPAQGYQQL
ncbi:sialate O-acetylesterase [Anoplopoma fimbria]|uniref:sialate O-acetylesterase n=1 Tax=Anoplopoma fimbria TaxID=229290 RepID=UPI0023ED5E72|nr:sialate O-acetylesterase [Anoplopoma fimbria]